jgi:hypothetical protein
MLAQALTLLSSFLFTAQPPPMPTAVATAQVAGRVVDADTSAAVPGAFVTLVPIVQQVRVAMNPPQAVTDTNGDFALERVWPGRYRIEVRKSGFAGLMDVPDRPTLDITAGASLNGLAFALRKGSVIAGRIVDYGGGALRAITVHALRVLPAIEGRAPGAMTMQMSQTNDRGEFRLADLPEGRYVVIAAPAPRLPFDTSQPPGGTVLAPTYYPGTTDREGAQVIDLGAAQTIDGVQFPLAALAARQIAGVVVDEAGSPQPDVTLMVMRSSGNVGPMTPTMVKTDQYGAFVVDGLTTGVYRLTAMIPAPVAVRDSVGANSARGGAGPVFAGVGGIAVAMPVGGILTQGLPSAEVTVGDADVTGVRIVGPLRR